MDRNSPHRRRLILSLSALAMATVVGAAHAADPVKVGVLIPGSKSDKGWMESGYTGLQQAEKEFGGKIKVQMIENINYADMEQALTNLASKNELVIGVGGQTQAAVFKVAKRFPKMKFSIVGGNQGESAPNVAGYDVKQAQIAYVAGAAAAMLSKNGAVSYVGGMEIPSIVNAGKEFGNGARCDQSADQVLRELHRRLRQRRQVQGSHAGRHRAGRGRALPHPQPRPARHGAGGEGKGHAHHRQLHRPLRQRPAVCRLQHHRRRLPGALRDRRRPSPAPGSRATRPSAWPWGRKRPT